MEENQKANLIVNLTLEFAIEVVKYCDVPEDRKKYVIARQLLKSGTSIGANVRGTERRKQIRFHS